MSGSLLFTQAHARVVFNAVKFIQGMENPFPFAEEEDLNHNSTGSDADSTTTTEEFFDLDNTESSVTDREEIAQSSKDTQGKVNGKISADEDRCKAIEDKLDKMDFTNWDFKEIIHACIDVWYEDILPAPSNESSEGVYDNTWANSEFADSSTLELLKLSGDSILNPQPGVSHGSGEMPYHWETPPMYLSQLTRTRHREPRYMNAFFGRDLNKINYYRGAADFMHRRTMIRLDSLYYKPKDAFGKRFKPAIARQSAFDVRSERRRDHGKSRLWFENRYTF